MNLIYVISWGGWGWATGFFRVVTKNIFPGEKRWWNFICQLKIKRKSIFYKRMNRKISNFKIWGGWAPSFRRPWWHRQRLTPALQFLVMLCSKLYERKCSIFQTVFVLFWCDPVPGRVVNWTSVWRTLAAHTATSTLQRVRSSFCERSFKRVVFLVPDTTGASTPEEQSTAYRPRTRTRERTRRCRLNGSTTWTRRSCECRFIWANTGLAVEYNWQKNLKKIKVTNYCLQKQGLDDGAANVHDPDEVTLEELLITSRKLLTE